MAAGHTGARPSSPVPILILDEPTSAMDPWAEAERMDKLREEATGRITILITHRLTTAMCADTIYVMQVGRIIESGSHTQLLAKCGEYANLWTARADGPLHLNLPPA